MKLTNDELDAILTRAGLKLEQPYHASGTYRKDKYLFTTCLHCGTEAHYRLKYILEKNDRAEQVCRACYWRAWYQGSHELYDAAEKSAIANGMTRRELFQRGILTVKEDTSWAEAMALARKNDYELIDLIRCEHPGDDIMIVRCNACGRQSAMRPQDVVFGCTCSKAANARRGNF